MDNNPSNQIPDLPEDLDKALEDMDNKLNLTADEKDIIDDINNPELEKEFNDFMKSMENGESDPMANLTNVMGDLLKNLGTNFEEKKGDETNAQPNEQFKKMEEMFSKLEKNPNFDNFTNKLLDEFMDKEILEEPLKEAKESYTNFLKEKGDTLNEDDKTRFIKQSECINELLVILEKDPQNKIKLVETFEKMQEYGSPPEEITKSVEKDSPFNLFQMMNEKGGPQPQPQNMGFDPNSMNPENCKIF